MGVRQPQPEGEVAVCDKATFVVETRMVKKASAARRDRLTSHTRVTVQCSAVQTEVVRYVASLPKTILLYTKSLL